MKNTLIFGASGLLGSNYINFSKFKKFIVHKNKNKIKKNLDKKIEVLKFKISKKNVSKILSQKKIDIIINCSGLTNVEKCEKFVDKSFYLNVEIPNLLANLAFKKGIKFVHISTDHFVSRRYPIKETDKKLKCLNIYSKHKLLSEKKILKTNCNALIIRTNFFGKGTYKKSFSETILNNLKKKTKIQLFKNVFFTPIYLPLLIKYIDLLIRNKKKGIFNVCSNESVSKFQFGDIICKVFNYNENFIKPISIENKKNLVKRPHNMSLDNTKLKKYIKMAIPSLKKQIRTMRKDFTNEKKKKNTLW